MYGFVQPESVLDDIRKGKYTRELDKEESISKKNTSVLAKPEDVYSISFRPFRYSIVLEMKSYISWALNECGIQ